MGGRRREMEQLIEQCDEAWTRIREITKEEDLDVMLANYVEVRY